MVANIKQVIEATRNELVEWWDKCYFSQQQREAFKPFFSDDFSEELLEQHDTEVQHMKQLCVLLGPGSPPARPAPGMVGT